jgi:hypothetical protein
MELSLVKLDDSVPQPPKAKPRTRKTIRTGQTRELERTVPPLFLDFISTFKPPPSGYLHTGERLA